MSVVSYKCPHCGGGLNYSPGVGFKCEYCLSVMTKEQLSALTDGDIGEDAGKVEGASDVPAGEGSAAKETGKPEPSAGKSGEALEYECPSCGAHIITDATTAATNCHYCHNPVVLASNLGGEFKPDGVIAFKIDRKKAVEMFKQHCSGKPFLPKDFYSEDQIENLCGVYYPYWLVDAKVDGKLTARGEIDRVTRQGDDRVVDTAVYDIERSGIINLDNITSIALKKGDQLILKYILPFKTEELQDFSMQYLSGFRAEKRDIERKDLQTEVDQRKLRYTESLLSSEVSGYTRVSGADLEAKTVEENWKYALLPVWILTYKYNGETYVYGINGQTGKSYGSLPINKRKLALSSILIGILAAVFALLIGGMFF